MVTCHACGWLFWWGDAREVGEVDRLGDDDVPADWREAKYLLEPDVGQYFEVLESEVARDRPEEKKLRILAWQKSNDLVMDSPGSSLEPVAAIGGAIGLLSLVLWIDIGLGMVSEHAGANPPFTAFVMTALAAAMISAAWVLPPIGRLFVESDRDRLPEGMRVKRLANIEALAALCDPNDQDERLMLAELLRELGRFDEAAALLTARLPAELAWFRAEIDALCQAGDRKPRWLRTPGQ
jgi:hypothetical protein